MAFLVRKNKIQLFMLCSLLALLLSLSESSLASQPVQLSFGLYASDKPTSLVKKFRPILTRLEQALSHRLGQPVSIKLSIAKTYQDGIDDLVHGKVDFVRFGPASYVLAKNNNPGIQLLAMETRKGKKHFNGVICVHKGSPIRKLGDLKGHSFAFGNEHSTIGRYLAQQFLLQHGITFYSLNGQAYLGRHDSVGYAVARGKFDAGALKESTLKKLIRNGQPLKVIAQFTNVTKPWVAREGLDTKIVHALKQSLLNLKDKDVLAKIKKDGFTQASETDYLAIENAIRDNSKFFDK